MTRRPIIWGQGALADLHAIAEYIAKNNPKAAGAVKKRIAEEVGRLAQMPSMGRPGRVDGTRELIISGLPFIVAYSVENERVRVPAVIHAARRWPVAFQR